MRALLFVLCWKKHITKEAHLLSSFIDLPQVRTQLPAITLLKSINLCYYSWIPLIQNDLEYKARARQQLTLSYLRMCLYNQLGKNIYYFTP